MQALQKRLANTALADKVRYFAIDEKPQLIASLIDTLEPSDSLVIKGSNGMGLSEVVDALKGM